MCFISSINLNVEYLKKQSMINDLLCFSNMFVTMRYIIIYFVY